MTEMRVMDRSGDTKTIFDPDKDDEVQVARTTFQELKRKGYIAYRVDEQGKKAEVMTHFDPRAGSIILSPPMAGG